MASKLFGVPPAPYSMAAHLPPLFLIADFIETFGLLIFLGLFTRPVAFILAGEMAVAYFMMRAPHRFLPLQNGGEFAVLYCFIFLYLVFAGGGAWSIDRLLDRRRG
jgi:putative oxidoreductase